MPSGRIAVSKILIVIAPVGPSLLLGMAPVSAPCLGAASPAPVPDVLTPDLPSSVLASDAVWLVRTGIVGAAEPTE